MFSTTGNTMMLGGARVQPRPVYTPQQTQNAMSQVQGAHRQGGDLYGLMKQYDRPGVGRSEATLSMAMPQQVRADVAGRAAQGGLYMDDTVANQKNMLTGSIARDREMLGLGNLAARMAEIEQRNQLGQQGQNYGLISQLMGSY